MDRFCADYSGGILSFYSLSNGGAFMAPETDSDAFWSLFNAMCQQRVKSDPLTVTTNGLILIHLVYSGLASAITPAFRFCFSR